MTRTYTTHGEYSYTPSVSMSVFMASMEWFDGVAAKANHDVTYVGGAVKGGWDSFGGNYDPGNIHYVVIGVA